MKASVLTYCLAIAVMATTLLAMSRPPQVVVTVKSAYPAQVARWEAATIKVGMVGQVDKVALRIIANRWKYEPLQVRTGVPWKVIGCLHNMESGGSFRKHLHEGSSLMRRTKYIPRGRPIKGSPPFTWEDSAYDALYTLKRMDRIRWHDLGAKLEAMERYNGMGYQKYHKNVPSPYLWSGTTIYVKGKYVADGKWDEQAVSSQIGCAAILKHLEK